MVSIVRGNTISEMVLLNKIGSNPPLMSVFSPKKPSFSSPFVDEACIIYSSQSKILAEIASLKKDYALTNEGEL